MKHYKMNVKSDPKGVKCW